MSYTVKIVTGCRIFKSRKWMSKNRKNWCQCLKKNHVFSSSPPSPPGLLLPGCWPPTASPPLGPWAHPWDVKHGAPEHSSFSGGLVVGGTSIVVVDYCPLLLKALPSPCCWSSGRSRVMTTRPTVGWCHSALEFIWMSTLALNHRGHSASKQIVKSFQAKKMPKLSTDFDSYLGEALWQFNKWFQATGPQLQIHPWRVCNFLIGNWDQIRFANKYWHFPFFASCTAITTVTTIIKLTTLGSQKKKKGNSSNTIIL